MADIQSELDLTFVEVGTQFRAVRSLVGALAYLSASAKSSLVDALNEVNAKTNSAGAVIDDANVSSSKTYSSSKIVSTVNDRAAALKAEILGGAGPTVDTLKEIADIIAQSDLDDDAALAALTTAVGYRLRFDEAQTLTAAQKVQGNANLGSVSLAQFGNPEHSYRTVLLAAINS